VYTGSRRGAQSGAPSHLGARGGEIMMSAFWSMGGYARYVWPCFGFAGAVLVWNLWSARGYLAAARIRAVRAMAMDENV
jgi:heme exporter protein CcmD